MGRSAYRSQQTTVLVVGGGITGLSTGQHHSAAVLSEPSTPDGPVEDPRTPSGRPGPRAPHAWLDPARTRSALDLFGGAFTLLTSPDRAGWVAPAGVERRGLDDAALARYGIDGTGASLVRPDGFVAWRSHGLPEDPEHELRRVLGHLLAVA